MSSSRHLLDPAHTDPKRLKKERERARELRATGWWKALVARGECHYCHRKFPSAKLTLDHVVPLARGGTSVRGNVVPACSDCNRDKKLDTPVDALFRELEAERARNEAEAERARHEAEAERARKSTESEGNE